MSMTIFDRYFIYALSFEFISFSSFVWMLLGNPHPVTGVIGWLTLLFGFLCTSKMNRLSE
jgi:hypothetical protein